MQMSELRKWEDLEFDCLVNVLGRVGMESLLLDVPFVCKSWHGASLDAAGWQHIDVPRLFSHPLFSEPRYSGDYPQVKQRFRDKYHNEDLAFDRFMSLIICRGLKKFAFLDLSSRWNHSEKYLQHVVEK